ncbi:Peptidyl-prolyl cis-trans isomerase [Nesidiocoris tenuis]|uniref:FK506-binding protein n=1 Tax=Nesidiocoris tenuis TaxID=355587 RepID=A0ABN7AQ90_9HEMI|nr:Peptidyl-prolyl cis-trans isomerase [Nesidiocoris tenuis]
MTSMFWGLRMEPGKRYSTTVGRSFHVSMASLDCSSIKQDNEINSVMLEEGASKVPFILCNLNKPKILQCPLDLNFMTGDRVTFFCLGSGVIHLSGYIHDDPEDDDLNLLGEEEEEEEDEDEAEEAEDESTSPESEKKKENRLQLKRKKEALAKKVKMSKLDEGVDDDEDDEMEMDGSDDEAEDEEGSEDEDDEGDESEDDDEVEEEEAEPPKKMQQKMKELKAKLQKNAQKTNGISTTQPSKNDKSKSDASVTPQSQKEAQKQKAAAGTPGKKTIEGGVQIKDIKVGTGKVCTPGKRASVYYIGRFRDNNKVFDSARKGNGFTFSVGKGEVIKGWDVGVVGMKVGGKRTIVCPPNMAYGKKGSPPTIPANSTLVFEVELKNVN